MQAIPQYFGPTVLNIYCCIFFSYKQHSTIVHCCLSSMYVANNIVAMLTTTYMELFAKLWYIYCICCLLLSYVKALFIVYNSLFHTI